MCYDSYERERIMKKKIKKKYTLREFKAWLSGIEEIQPDDWHPDWDQWRLIRDRMDNIVADVQEKIIEREVEVIKEIPIPVPVPSQAAPPAPSALAPPGPPVPPVPPPLIPQVVLPDAGMTPAAAAALRGELPKDPMAEAKLVHRLPNDPAAANPEAPGTPYVSTFAG